jgi:hypothetical protein
VATIQERFFLADKFSRKIDWWQRSAVSFLLQIFKKNCFGGNAAQSRCVSLPRAGLPDGMFSNQNSQFGKILEGLAMEDVSIFCGHSVYLTVILYIFRPFTIVCGHLVYFSPFWYLCCTKKNLASLVTCLPTTAFHLFLSTQKIEFQACQQLRFVCFHIKSFFVKNLFFRRKLFFLRTFFKVERRNFANEMLLKNDRTYYIVTK